MSRRTSEASKAIQVAWQKERELVIKGQGTRDWTPEQQKEIITLGKAYYHSEEPDDINDGKAFVGHHMKSVEAYPEYQGEPENIQFLSYAEHKEAHSGDFKNSTNGYFDPETKRIQDFGDEKYVPCKIIKLTNSIKIPINVDQEALEKILSDKFKIKKRSEKQCAINHTMKEQNINIDINRTKKQRPREDRLLNKIFEGNKKLKMNLPELLLNNLGIIQGLGKIAIDVLTAFKKSQAAKFLNHSSKSSDDNSSVFFDKTANNELLSESDRNNLNKRSTPKMHTVKNHPQLYHTNDGPVIIEKKSYQRGGKHDAGI